MVNLQWSFLFLLYKQDDTKFVNIIISLAGVHFICIVAYHFVTYGCGGATRNKIELRALTISKLVTKLFDRSVKQLDFQERMFRNIPEVLFNYREYQ